MCIAGLAYDYLQAMATERQLKARAIGTRHNHVHGVEVFLAFCNRLRLPPYQCSYFDFCVYIEYLSIYIPASATIRNKISQVRVHFALMEAPTYHICHPHVNRALEGVERDKNYVPRIKSPSPADVISLIASSLNQGPLDTLSGQLSWCFIMEH